MVRNQRYASLGSDDGLAPNRRQAIIWTNAGLVSWPIYAPLGRNELIPPYEGSYEALFLVFEVRDDSVR